MSQSVADALHEADVPVIAVNSTHRLTKQGWMTYAADDEWWLHPDNKDVFGFAGHKVTLFYSETKPLAARGVQMLKRDNGNRYSDDPSSVATLGNSGAQAIQIAVKTGAKRVLLCGFDMRVTKQNCHWHGPHPHGLRATDPGVYEGWREKISAIAPALLKRCEVINCTPESALQCFPMMSLEDALAACTEPAA